MQGSRSWALVLLLCASAAHAEGEAETIDGHERVWWSQQARAHERAVERLAAALEACEAREAPPAYRGAPAYRDLPGQPVRGRDGVRYREPLRCDETRAELAAAEEASEAFEELARRLGVPPGWLR